MNARIQPLLVPQPSTHIPLEPIPKKPKAVAAAALLAPVPSAVQFLTTSDARFVTTLADKDSFPSSPTLEQRRALVLAASKTSTGILLATQHRGFDANAVGEQLATTSKLVWALGKTELSADERSLLRSAVETSNLAADALAGDEPRLWYSATKERAFNELARATHHSGLTTLPGEIALSKRAQTRAMTFQHHKLDHIRALAPVVSEIKTAMAQKLDAAIAALKPLTAPGALRALVFAARQSPDLQQHLRSVGLSNDDATKLANAARQWTQPPPFDPLLSHAEQRAHDRLDNLREMRRSFDTPKSGADALADLLASYPDMATAWCLAARFTNVLAFPLDVTPAQANAMQPAERAVYEALLKRSGWKHTLADLAPTIASSIALGTAFAVMAVPAVIAGAATAAIVGAPRVLEARKDVTKKQDQREVGLASDTAIDRARDAKMAAAGTVLVDAVTAGVASKIGGASTLRHGLAYAKSLAAQFGIDAGLGAGAGVLTRLMDPAFWKEEAGHAGALFEASVVGIAGGAIGTSAGLALGAACKLVFMPNIAGVRLRAGSEVSIDTDKLRVSARVLSLDAHSGSVVTDKGTFQVHDAKLFPLDADALLHRWEAADDGAVVLVPYVAPPQQPKVTTFDKANLSPQMRRVYEKGTPAQQSLMRALGDEWLSFSGTEIVSNPRLAQLFERYGDAVTKWLGKHAVEAQTIVGLDSRLSGGVLDCFETKTFAELQPFLHQFMFKPLEVKAFFALHEKDEIAQLIKTNALKDKLDGLAATFVLANGKSQLIAGGAKPIGAQTASSEERALLAESAGVADSVFSAPAKDLRALQKLIARMKKDLDPSQQATLDLELLGRRLVDDVHFEPLQTAYNPEHGYGMSEWRGWRRAEARMAKAAADHEPLSEALLNTLHAQLQLTPKKGMRSTEWVTQSKRVVSRDVLAQLQKNPDLKVKIEAQLPSGHARVLVIYADPAKVGVRMRRLLEQIEVEIQGGVDPITVAARAQRELVSIHPYTDGNGRMSRLVMDYVLLRSGGAPSLLKAPGKDTDVRDDAWRTMVQEGVERAFAVIEKHWKHAQQVAR